MQDLVGRSVSVLGSEMLPSVHSHKQKGTFFEDTLDFFDESASFTYRISTEYEVFLFRKGLRPGFGIIMFETR